MTAPQIPNLAKTTTLAEDPAFEARVLAALIFQARTVIQGGKESATEFSWAYALAIVRNPRAYSPAAAWVLATDPTIAAANDAGADISDLMIGGAVLGTWPHLAGIAI